MSSRHVELPSELLIRFSNRVDLLKRAGSDVADDLKDSFLSSERKMQGREVSATEI